MTLKDRLADASLALDNWKSIPLHPRRRAAIIIGTAPTYVDRLLASGVLTSRRIGHRRLVETASIVRLLDKAEPVHA